ncbi:trigger factor [Arcobacter sp. FWKO B]|uniref:trigger factor n=1 Tax=Arcobacter sp. FWKO B TaxID=2593672 RepID=UPI0018A6717C|nr:trigger factor [Arcobacter sp. FWKO B]QOG12043.1 trigger factor [Arcobacter sp. FWKO B]
MKLNATKIDSANANVAATITTDVIATNLEKMAKQLSKTMNVAGFRKGKVPVNVVKQMHGDKLQEDAQAEALRVLFADAIKELAINPEDVIGEPAVTKYDKKEDGSIEVEVKFSVRPAIDLGDYKALIPAVEDKEVSDKEVEERIAEMASKSAPLEKIARKRALKDGDYAVIDFEGFVDGVPFDGGKAEKYTLQVGSGSFIPGFEEQMIGMKYEETKDVVVTFPTEYQAKDLAGKEAVFKVTLHEIQQKGEAELNDDLAKKMLPNEKEATLDMLKEKVKEQLKSEKMSKYYNEDLKPAYLEALVAAISFDLPQSVVSQEINAALNNEIRAMSEEALNKLKEDAKEIEALREKVTPDAHNSVKATFIIDALAKAENVDVSDQEVTQTLYYEAMMMGQNPQEVVKFYSEKGYLPAIRMSMIEDKVITKLLDSKLKS